MGMVIVIGLSRGYKPMSKFTLRTTEKIPRDDIWSSSNALRPLSASELVACHLSLCSPGTPQEVRVQLGTVSQKYEVGRYPLQHLERDALLLSHSEETRFCH